MSPLEIRLMSRQMESVDNSAAEVGEASIATFVPKDRAPSCRAQRLTTLSVAASISPGFLLLKKAAD